MSTPPVSLLRDIPFFEGLTPGELERAAGVLHMQRFAAGASLFSSDQPGEVAYIILKGAVKVFMEQSNGRSVLLAILGPGEIVGEMSLVDHLARSASAVTMDDCSALWLDRADFWRCLEEIPSLNYNLARILARRLRRANAHIQSLAALDLYGRVARQLMVLAREYGESLSAPVEGPRDTSRRGTGPLLGASTGMGTSGASYSNMQQPLRIPFRLTQSDLSNLVGASRGRVNQVLVSFKERGFIAVDPQHHITLLNMAALTALCE
jgi:CRP-like cAMP-binding protein